MPKASQISDKEYTDFAVMIGANIRTLPPEVVAYYLDSKHRAEIPGALVNGFQLPDEAEESVIKQLGTVFRWTRGMIDLYKKYMEIDITPDLLNFIRTDQRIEFNWSVYRPQGLTARKAIDLLCKPQFKVEEHINVADYSLERDSNESHLVLCRETVEPDAEWHGKSANDMQATTTPFLDLCDRAVLEAIYYFVHKKHLDIKGVTRCPRSRCGDGAAYAGWNPRYRGFDVDAGAGDLPYPDFGGREAMVLPRKS